MIDGNFYWAMVGDALVVVKVSLSFVYITIGGNLHVNHVEDSFLGVFFWG